MNKILSKFSILTLIPLFVTILLLVLFAKNYFFDIPKAIAYEKEKFARKLPLIASRLQSNYTHYLIHDDITELNKAFAQLELDHSHYKLVLILDKSLKPIYSYHKNLLYALPLDIKKELVFHDVSSIIDKKAININYDDRPNHLHFDIAIPLVIANAKKEFRNFNVMILYVQYSIEEELAEIKTHYKNDLIINFTFILLISLGFTFAGYFFILKNILKLTELTNRFSTNDFSARSDIKGLTEFNKLSENFNTMAQTIENDFNIIKEQNHDLSKFKRIVEQSPVMVMITGPNDRIEYVNPILLKTYKYSQDEILGKTPRIFKSGMQDEKFYQTMWNSILTQGMWKGHISNHTKYNKLVVEDMQIFPIKDETGKLTNYIGIKNDITKSIEQQKILSFQAKLAQMGEMISMIAHQWRQPLSAINAITATNMINIHLNNLDEENLLQSLQNIENITLHLSSTIESFSNFFKSSNKKTTTSFFTIVQKTLGLVQHTLHNINLDIDMDAISSEKFESYEGELVQVLLNFFKNSADKFSEENITEPTITITTSLQEDSIILTYQDNAGGSDVTPIEKIFEPYFTTKAELQGTGIGLYMSKTIVVEHCKGRLQVKNIKDGIEFSITLPRYATQ